MTFDEIRIEYNRQTKIDHEQFQAWQTAGRPKPMAEHCPFTVDYSGLNDALIQAMQSEYGLSLEQSQFIFSITYEDYHASYGDVIGQIPEYVHRFQVWDKIK